MRRLLSALVTTLLFVGCSASSNDTSQAGGSGVPYGQARCAYGDCALCATCADLCQCETGDTADKCAQGCGPAVSYGQPRCAYGDCRLCATCVDRCQCNGEQLQTCTQTCGGGSGGSGATGSGGSGATGTGGSGAVGTGGSGAVGTGGSGAVGGSGGSYSGDLPLAGGMRITEISAWQSVKIPLMQNGGEVGNRNAPVVLDKDVLIRVYVAPDADWQQREIIARLELDGSGGPATQEVRKVVQAASTDADKQSSFNFDVPAARVTGDSRYSVALLETSNAQGPGSTAGSRFPGQGMSNLGGRSSNGAFQVKIVPITVSGFTPDVSQGKVDQYHQYMKAMYPAPDVEIQVAQAVNYGGTVSANGSGWQELLSALRNFRSSDPHPRNQYYYGAIAPAQSLRDFCGYGCVAGLGYVGDPRSDSTRVAIGLGYFPDGTGGTARSTMAHELGHALGRNHAPCAPAGGSISGVDPGYPNQTGSIGVWGYEGFSTALRDPARYTDVMGYCQYVWISDYTYRNIFDMIAYVNANPLTEPASEPLRAAGRFRTAVLHEDGTLTWTGTVDLQEPATGEAIEVQTYDSAQNPTGKIKAFLTRFDHLGGGSLYVPEQPLTTGGVQFVRPIGGIAPVSVDAPAAPTLR